MVAMMSRWQQFFGEQRYAFPEFWNSFNRLVQGIVGHGVLWCRGLMTEGLRDLRHLPAPLIRTEKNIKYW